MKPTPKKKKSLLDLWQAFIGNKSKTRPENVASYGDGMDKMTMRLPKSVQEQLKLVNMMNLVDSYPNDWELQIKFFREIAPHCNYLKETPTLEMLGFEGTQELITLYADLLLRPLSQRAAMKIQTTIQTLLPTQMESEEQ